MKRKGVISDFFVKKHKSATDQVKADPSPDISSHSGASQASQSGQTQGPSPPPPGKFIEKCSLTLKQKSDFEILSLILNVDSACNNG